MKFKLSDLALSVLAVLAIIVANKDVNIVQSSSDGGGEYPYPSVTLRSVGGYDGWTEESSEDSETGGSSHDIYDYVVVGDGPADEQYRAIFSFNTTSLPDNANIIAVELRLKYYGANGTLPFETHNGLYVDINTPAFAGWEDYGIAPLDIVPGDFEAVATKLLAAEFSAAPINGWYTANIPSQYISKTETTQFRLRFLEGDNDDNSSDYIMFYQGDTADIASRPQLVVTYTIPSSVTLRSVGEYDGWIEESSENSETGDSGHNTYDAVAVGDGPADEQYRAIISFNTAPLPDNANITAVEFGLKYYGVVGTLPFETHNGLYVDVNTPAFAGWENYGIAPLEITPGDFEAPATKLLAAKFSATPIDGWYFANIPSQYISKTETTQFRLRFLEGDNDDNSSDYIMFYQGDYADSTSHPQLRITYTVPSPNDDFGSAISISPSSMVNFDTQGATQNSDDPVIPNCNLNAGEATVWYKYTPASNTAISFDTFDANYDTFIAVWTGTRTNLDFVACNNDANETKQSAVAFQAKGGTTYYIEVGQP